MGEQERGHTPKEMYLAILYTDPKGSLRADYPNETGWQMPDGRGEEIGKLEIDLQKRLWTLGRAIVPIGQSRNFPYVNGTKREVLIGVFDTQSPEQCRTMTMTGTGEKLPEPRR